LISFLISIKAKANHNGEGILNTFPERMTVILGVVMKYPIIAWKSLIDSSSYKSLIVAVDYFFRCSI